MKASKSSFLKSSLDTPSQIALLQRRGLVIRNPSFAKKCLDAVSYYRLSAYFDTFYQDINRFKTGSTFEAIWELYVFDRRLRLCFIDALERIEVALRTSLSNTMSNRYGAFRCFVFRPKYVHAFGNLVCESRSFYEQAFVIGKLQAAIAPQSRWKQRLYALFQEFPDVPFNLMGFKENWQNDPFWEVE